MPSSMNSRVSSFLCVGLYGVILLIAPFYLWSQGALLGKQVYSSTGQPFSEFDDSLNKTADTLLAFATLSTPPAGGKLNAEKTTNGLPATSGDRRSWLSGGGSNGSAELRLKLLRPDVDPILASHGVPTDLAAIILVESAGRSTALSPNGARGLWQLMPDTARRYGLRVDGNRDDRLDRFRATDAAARYLHYLYGQFGDWRLALAAYNSGESNVGLAILKAHTQNFDQLANLRMLPLETRNYVPRVLATAQLIGQSQNLEEIRDSSRSTVIFAVNNP